MSRDITGLLAALMNPAGMQEEEPKKPDAKTAAKDFASTLMFTLGESFKASASAPGGRGTRAGQGAAFQAPMLLQQIRQAEADRQAKLKQDQADWITKINQQGIENALKERQAGISQGNLEVAQDAEKRLSYTRNPVPEPGKDVPFPQAVEEQKLRLSAKASPENLSLEEKIMAAWIKKNPGKDAADYQAYRDRINAAKSSTNVDPRLVNSVLANPAMYGNLTPSVRTEIAPELAAAGFTGFGQPMAETAINKIAETRSAMGSLKDLREVLVNNEQYIGPLAGLQSINPYSEGRKAQADIARVRQRAGKALEGGVLRKEDEAKYRDILATLTDVPDTAIYKVDQMLEDLARDMDIFIEEQKNAGRRVNVGTPTKAAAPAGVAPEGTIATSADGKRQLIKRNGQWIPK